MHDREQEEFFLSRDMRETRKWGCEDHRQTPGEGSGVESKLGLFREPHKANGAGVT